MKEVSIEETVSNLQQRVAHLEREVETSYEEEQFKRRVSSFFPDDATIEYRDGHYGHFARISGLDGDEIQVALDKLEKHDFGSAVTETADGPGMEVWSEPEV